MERCYIYFERGFIPFSSTCTRFFFELRGEEAIHEKTFTFSISFFLYWLIGQHEDKGWMIVQIWGSYERKETGRIIVQAKEAKERKKNKFLQKGPSTVQLERQRGGVIALCAVSLLIAPIWHKCEEGAFLCPTKEKSRRRTITVRKGQTGCCNMEEKDQMTNITICHVTNQKGCARRVVDKWWKECRHENISTRVESRNFSFEKFFSSLGRLWVRKKWLMRLPWESFFICARLLAQQMRKERAVIVM